MVNRQQEAINPAGVGTKAAAHYQITVGGGKEQVIRLRLTTVSSADTNANPFGRSFDALFAERLQEADEFYASVIPRSLDDDSKNVMRQAIAGMLWSKQFYSRVPPSSAGAEGLHPRPDQAWLCRPPTRLHSGRNQAPPCAGEHAQ